MRILSLTAQKPAATGSGVYLTETVREFARLGHAQAVVAGVSPGEPVALPKEVRFFPVYFNTSALPFSIAGMSDEMPYPSTVYREMTGEMVTQFKDEFRRVVQTAAEEFQPDVILCHHLYLLTALTREWFPQKQVWGICHGTDLRQMQTNPLQRDYIRRNIARLDRIFCLHQQQKKEVLACYGADAARIRVVGNGYNNHIFYNKELRKPHPETRLVFAGKISEKKGVLSLLRTLPLLGWEKAAFSLRLAGGWGSDSQKEQALALIKQGGYNVALLGNLTQGQLAEEFNQGDIFVLPSFYDGLPLVLAESMACGMKVICTDLPGIRPWMDDKVPGHKIRFVAPPLMKEADVPIESSLPAFHAGLAEAIKETAAAPIGPPPDLSALSWAAVCCKMLSTPVYEKNTTDSLL